MEQSGSVRRLTITGGQLAAKFGISLETLKKRLPWLEDAGFPRKLPGMNAWSEPAVDHWFHNWGRAPIEPVKLNAIEDVRQQLEAQYSSDAGKAAA